MEDKMFDHVGITVTDFAKSLAFYTKALAPLGISVKFEVTREMSGDGAYVGFGIDQPQFWIGGGKNIVKSLHVAFAAKDRATVDAFYKAAMAAGGTDNGPPGLRPIYHPDYYGAFVLDPDGNNVEAVCHKPE
jgi:catechol 2,3-dioxygenase-like lactoylglutathione lyase family enzyme